MAGSSGSSRSSFDTYSLYRSMLDKKADSKVVDAQIQTVEAKLAAIEKDGMETREIALSARKTAGKPHACLHSDLIKKLADFMDNTKTVKFASAIGLAILIGGVAYQSKSQADRNESTDKVIVEVKKTMERVEDEVGSLKTEQRSEKVREKKEENKQMEQFVKEATKAFIEASKKKRHRSQ